MLAYLRPADPDGLSAIRTFPVVDRGGGAEMSASPVIRPKNVIFAYWADTSRTLDQPVKEPRKRKASLWHYEPDKVRPGPHGRGANDKEPRAKRDRSHNGGQRRGHCLSRGKAEHDSARSE